MRAFMERSRISRLMALAGVATTALFGAACDDYGGDESPGQEAPSDTSDGDDGQY